MRLWGHIRNVLLGAMGAWGVGLMLRSLLGYPTWYVPALAGLGLAVGILAALAVRWKKGQIVCFVLCLGLGLFSGVIISGSFVDGVYCLTAGMEVFLAILRGGYGFYTPLGICGTLSLLCGMWMGDESILLPSALLAVTSVLLTIDGLRERSLRKGQLQSQIASVGSGPAGLMENSVLLTVLFIAGAIGVAVLLYLLFLLSADALNALVRRITAGAMDFYAWMEAVNARFYEWFWSHFDPTQEKPGTHIPEIRGGGIPLATGVAAVPVMLLLLAGGGAAILGIGTALVLRRKIKRVETARTQDYEDTVEWLERPKGKIRKRISALFRREAWRQYRGNLKIRYAFQQMLKRRWETDPMVRTKTPNELRRDSQEENALIDAYNRIRYGSGEATEAELSVADQVLTELK